VSFFASLAFGLTVFSRKRPNGSAKVDELFALLRKLLSGRGEVSGARLAGAVVAAYQALDAGEVEKFFDYLAEGFSPDPAVVQQAAETYHQDPSQANLVRLQKAVESPRQELFRRWNMAPGAAAELVALRKRLLTTLDAHPERAGIDADLSHLFRSWFNRGFLVLERIDWRTPAVVLERLIEYEAVHEVQGWRDLRRRLQSDRRCYAFFHPALPDEPLIFIEVALTRGMSGHVQPLLDPHSAVDDPARADCAIFYSITTCQEGLRGVSFGNFLIKQVVENLGREFPRVKTFATLSPIPGFRAWLNASYPRWQSVDAASASPAARNELSSLCALYLLDAKRQKEPLDPVARFHLANGARLERLNWMGDTSIAGLDRSLGLMANYVYRLADVEKNHEAYAAKYQVIASPEIERLARRARNSSTVRSEP
jgi:malonyl-CoA decarboxylase